ncbi:anthranilate phosphoribosyltransferase [Thalassococcus sp. BH17M4-6]|uniref:anthranilate phosphoribosyltransferase n=1 Tax=Thalassococcus sp. BH17M4-6 TaxID=3413148 RepID=UPI003BE4B95E
MTPDQTAAAVIAGRKPTEDAMLAYWQATDRGLRTKAETVAVLAALSAAPSDDTMMRSFVRYIRDTYPPVALPAAREAVNIVGTGGGPSTFNISTTSAFVVAAAGGKVLKSGSSAYSSSVGSGDILNALGLARSASDDFTDAMLAETGLAFASPQRYAPICKRLAIAAMPLNFKVIGRFVNGLGPLICPYQMRAHVIGVSTPRLFEQIHSIAKTLGIPSLLVHSKLGVDEFLSIGPNRWLWAAELQANHLDPVDMGLERSCLNDLQGGDLDTNIEIMTAVLKGQGNRACTETVALNAGVALYAGGVASDLRTGTRLALDCLKSGAPFDKLEQAQAFARSEVKKLERVA